MKFIEAKLVTIGDWSVGKTSIVKRHIDKSFETFHRATIGACFFYNKVNVGDCQVTLHVWDTAGEERFKSLMPMYYRTANAVFMIFDMTSCDSFTRLKFIYQEFKNYCEENVVLALVANKLDLITKREVTEKEARDFALLIGATYHETSALQDIGIDELFGTATTGLVELVNEGKTTSMKIYDNSKIVQKNHEEVLKLIKARDNKKNKRKKCSCK